MSTNDRVTLKPFLLWSLLVAALPCMGCDYERMKDQESVRTYEVKFPEMPSESIPFDPEHSRAQVAGLLWLVNPLPMEPKVIEQGKKAYGHYCSMCHGKRADGLGTVGQSFYPLPSDLRSPAIQALSDGDLFRIISLGSKRSPPLGATISEGDRWAIVAYIRHLAGSKED